MKKCALFFLIVPFLFSSCLMFIDSKDYGISGNTFRDVDSYSTFVELTDEQAVGKDFRIDEDGKKYISVDVIETQTLIFNPDKTLIYKCEYNQEFLEFYPDRNEILEGTYKIHNHGKKLEISIPNEDQTKNGGNLSRDFDIVWDEDGHLELHAGFLDQTLFLDLVKIS